MCVTKSGNVFIEGFWGGEEEKKKKRSNLLDCSAGLIIKKKKKINVFFGMFSEVGVPALARDSA